MTFKRWERTHGSQHGVGIQMLGMECLDHFQVSESHKKAPQNPTLPSFHINLVTVMWIFGRLRGDTSWQPRLRVRRSGVLWLGEFCVFGVFWLGSDGTSGVVCHGASLQERGGRQGASGNRGLVGMQASCCFANC